MDKNDPPETTRIESDQINKPLNKFEELYPDWPTVRCTECGTNYKIENASTISLNDYVKNAVAGDCPNCHNETFNTKMPKIPNGLRVTYMTIDEVINPEIALDPKGTTGFKVIEIKDTNSRLKWFDRWKEKWVSKI